MSSYKITVGIITTAALLAIPFSVYSRSTKLESEEAAQKFIETERAKNGWYDLRLISELGKKGSIEKKVLYVGLVDGIIRYKVLGNQGCIIEGVITADDLGDSVMPISNELRQFSFIKNAILKITSDRGHTENKGGNIGAYGDCREKIIPMPEGGM